MTFRIFATCKREAMMKGIRMARLCDEVKGELFATAQVVSHELLPVLIEREKEIMTLFDVTVDNRDTMFKETFRDYCNRIYGEYMLEMEHENVPTRLDVKTYFNRYKWWLRAQYRKQYVR